MFLVKNNILGLHSLQHQASSASKDTAVIKNLLNRSQMCRQTCSSCRSKIVFNNDLPMLLSYENGTWEH